MDSPDQRTRLGRVHLIPVKRQTGQIPPALYQERIFLIHHVGEEDIGRLAALTQSHRSRVLRGVLHDVDPLPSNR